MDSGPSGSHMDQSPVIFQGYSGPSSVRGVSRPQGVEVSYGPGGNHMDQGPVIFENYSGPSLVRSVWRLRGAEVNSGSDILRENQIILLVQDLKGSKWTLVQVI